MDRFDRTFPIKREVVSAETELISEIHSFPVGISCSPGCKKCQRERTKNPKIHVRQKGKRRPAKANTPIVIQLKDTLKAALKQKHRLMDSGEPAKFKGEMESPDEFKSIFSASKSNYYKHSHDEIENKRKDVKNLSAWISVIERAHQKEASTSSSNLSHQPRCENSKFVAEYVLNNVSHTTEPVKDLKRKNIIECENVELICNDLTNSSGKSSDSPDDSESENSSVTSNSEIHSDSDYSNSVSQNSTFEFTSEELEKLADYTTGCPFIQYNCSPFECPRCLSSWFGSQYYMGCNAYQPTDYNSSEVITTQKQRRDSIHAVEVESDLESSVSDVLPDFDTNSSSASLSDKDTNCGEWENVSLSQASRSVNSRQKQLIDIDISGKFRATSFTDGVYIDLTDTDVDFTVYYHKNMSEDEVRDNYASPEGYSFHSLPVSMSSSAQSFYPAYYPHIYSVPSAFCVPMDSSTIPKTLMIPPDDLHEFHTTQPPQRQWIPLASPDRSRPTAIYTVMCYNVLCDKYCTRQQYGYCPSWALNWEYRKKGIIEEIRTCSADIISLQEVETDMFYSFFLPELKRDGYEGIFSPKSRARTMTEQERKHVDGCAIFYRTSKFSLKKEHLIEFNQLAMANAEGSDDMLNRVMTKDNIGLAAMLETKEGVYENGLPPEGLVRQPILVVTAHIHWDPEYSDVKLIQTMMLMWELKHILEESANSFRPGTHASDCNSIPLLLCGDLNSLPESGVIEFLNSGKVAANHTDFKEHGYEECLRRINCTNQREALSHDFRLSRAYDNDVMPYTNYTFDFKGIIDYIFYSREHMNLLGILGPLDETWIRQNKVVGCPHPHVPSDHFSLFVEFEMPVQQRPNNTHLKHR